MKVFAFYTNDTIIKVSDLPHYLGPAKYHHQKNDISSKSGIVNALAYTIYGGEILKVSSTMYKGEGKIKITGQIGDIMNESVDVALSYIKHNAKNFGINIDIFKENDFHIHIEEGSVKKDGPSAGITITTAIISLIKDIVIPNDISMTGEITLRGRILPIGGLKEKLIAATVNNIKRVFIPIDNKVDIEEISENIKNKLEIIYVRDYLDVYFYLFNEQK